MKITLSQQFKKHTQESDLELVMHKIQMQNASGLKKNRKGKRIRSNGRLARII